MSDRDVASRLWLGAIAFGLVSHLVTPFARAWVPDLSVMHPTYNLTTDSIVVSVAADDTDRWTLVKINAQSQQTSLVQIPCGEDLPQAVSLENDGIAVLSWRRSDADQVANFDTAPQSLHVVSLTEGTIKRLSNNSATRINAMSAGPASIFLARGNYRGNQYIARLDLVTMDETRLWPVSPHLGQRFNNLGAPRWTEGDRLVVHADISVLGRAPSWAPDQFPHYYLVTPGTDRIEVHLRDREFGSAESVQRLGDRFVIVGPDVSKPNSTERIVVEGAEGTKVYPYPARGVWPPGVFQRPDHQLYSLTIDPIGQQVRLNRLSDAALKASWSYKQLRSIANSACRSR